MIGESLIPEVSEAESRSSRLGHAAALLVGPAQSRIEHPLSHTLITTFSIQALRATLS